MECGVEQNGQEVIKDDCEYKEECKSFQRCFDGTIPTEDWRSVSCFDQLIGYVNDWREYQNEQTTKQ